MVAKCYHTTSNFLLFHSSFGEITAPFHINGAKKKIVKKKWGFFFFWGGGKIRTNIFTGKHWQKAEEMKALQRVIRKMDSCFSKAILCTKILHRSP